MLSDEGHSDIITWMVRLLITDIAEITSSPRETPPRDAHILTSFVPTPVRKPHGRAWKVLDKERLLKQVLPKYYVCSKVESFTRQ